MRLEVTLESGRLREGKRAVRARVGALARVNHSVHLKVGALDERRWTFSARIGARFDGQPLFRCAQPSLTLPMHQFDVISQGGSLPKLAEAVGARVGLLSLVNQQVEFEPLVLPESARAVGA